MRIFVSLFASPFVVVAKRGGLFVELRKGVEIEDWDVCKTNRGGYAGGLFEKPIKIYLWGFSSSGLFALFSFCYNFYILFLAISIALEGFYYSTIL